MLKLEDITPGALVKGLDAHAPCEILQVRWYGDSALEVHTKNNSGSPRVLYRSDEPDLEIVPKTPAWNFEGDSQDLQLVSEAWRIHYAHLFDPYLAVHISDVQPLPHQISAVYQEMLQRQPLRYILADDPGAGKTIMTGLLIKELMARSALGRCLIVCPGNLVEQWQIELMKKFQLHFKILTRESMEVALTGNAFAENDLLIARLDMLARNEDLQKKLKATTWDLIVCDEAHKMSATIFGNEVKKTQRFQLGETLSAIAKNFLLLTATPHNGKEADFQQFLSLVDADRFGGVAKTGAQKINVSDIMRRLVKEDLLKFDGTPLFPDRQVRARNYQLSPLETELYEAVTEYVQSEFNRADNLAKKQRLTVGFALTVLQRRLASSPEAIYQSLRRRRERLENRLNKCKSEQLSSQKDLLDDDFDEDDLPDLEMEQLEEQLADQATAASNMAELGSEIATLKQLENLAAKLRASGTDRKWEELSDLLQTEDKMFAESGTREKLIIFTEHRDTLRYLADKIRSLLGDSEAVATIYGGMSRTERHRVEESFKQDKTVRVLVATDAAGEGINLQRSHLMINYDMPWNPNRLEQRFGRIHRIGQTQTCWLWNLVSGQTREGAVFERLFAKLEQEKNALGGKVFDVLGKLSFDNRPLRDLLIEAIRANNSAQQQSICDKVENAFNNEAYVNLIRQHALTEDVLNAPMVNAMREQMERMEARRLQPHYIKSFFMEAFGKLGGRISAAEKGLYEITHVPANLRNYSHNLRPVLPRYERVCFDKAFRNGDASIDLICPGHPLLEAIINMLKHQHGNVLKNGAILIDKNDSGTDCRLLVYIESSIQNNATNASGKPVTLSRQAHFVELTENGEAINAGLAPYLDYAPPTEQEKAALLPYCQNLSWLQTNLEDLAVTYAITKLGPPHLEQIKQYKLPIIEKTRREVQARLSAEIRYWDNRAIELKEQEKSGKRNAVINSNQARQRAEDLQCKLEKRLAQLDNEAKISTAPPRITGYALIVPQGLVYELLPETRPAEYSQDVAARNRIEKAAMATVRRIEEEYFHNTTQDVSKDKCGYDIESQIPEKSRMGHALRYIEVKGRAKGADTVIITRHEALFALTNPEQFILALVEVDGDKTSTTYIKKPITREPEASVCHTCYKINDLLQTGEVIYTEKNE